MSKVDELFDKLGEQGGDTVADPVTDVHGTRYRLTKKDLMKALAKMPDEAAIWNTMPGEDESSAKRAIKEALWATIEPAVRTMMQTPAGTYIEGK
jgi:hypothetical protein